MRICKNCGFLVEDTDRFCTHCGQKQDVEETATPVVPLVEEKKEEDQPSFENVIREEPKAPASKKGLVFGIISVVLGAFGLIVYLESLGVFEILMQEPEFTEAIIESGMDIDEFRGIFMIVLAFMCCLFPILSIVFGSISRKTECSIRASKILGSIGLVLGVVALVIMVVVCGINL